MTLHIACDILETLTQHAEAEFPNECCGILIGRQDPDWSCVKRVVPADNIAESDRRRAYQIDWRTLFEVIRSARRGPDEVVGFYHSHPDGTARPSQRDEASAWIDHSYLILSVQEGRCTGITSWRTGHQGASFQQERLS